MRLSKLKDFLIFGGFLSNAILYTTYFLSTNLQFIQCYASDEMMWMEIAKVMVGFGILGWWCEKWNGRIP